MSRSANRFSTKPELPPRKRLRRKRCLSFLPATPEAATAAFLEVWRGGSLARIATGSALTLPPASVSSTSDPLSARRHDVRIGIDLGGTKIEAIALDDSGSTLCRRRIATPAGDYHGTIDAVAALVFAIEDELGRTGTVGVGTPGALSLHTGLLKNSNSTVLNGRPLDADLARALEPADPAGERCQLLCSFRSNRRRRPGRRVGIRGYSRDRRRSRTGDA